MIRYTQGYRRLDWLKTLNSSKTDSYLEDTQEEVSNNVFTVPNAISLVRLLLVPVYLWLLFSGYNIYALIVFSIAALTDCLDGQVARRTHSVSKLGKLLDPAIDTILMFTGVLGIVLIGRVPEWFAVLIICREAFLLIGGGILLKSHDIRIAVIYPGKAATTFLFIGFAGMILNLPLINGLGVTDIWWLPGFNHDAVAVWIWFIYIGLVLQIGVTFYYCVKAYQALDASRSQDRSNAKGVSDIDGTSS